ncbi:MAG: fibronectin type III domain-containing protein [Flavobacterium psychrophilum]
MKNFIVHQAKTGLLFLFFGLLAQSGWGQTDLYWDANGATAGTGGTGTWNTAGTWRSGSATGTLGNWVDGSNAIFQGTAGTVTIPTTTTVTTNNITFSTTGYIVTGATSSGKLSLSTTNKTITVGSGVVAKIGTYVASSIGNAVLSGTGGMTIDGSGELILAAGLQSSLSGGVTVTGNSILTCGDRNNSTPILNGANSSAGFFGGNALVLNNGTLRLAAAAATDFGLSGLNGISVSTNGTGTFDIWRTSAAASSSPNLTSNSTATVAMGSNSTLSVLISGGSANGGNITLGNLTASGNFTLKSPQAGFPGLRFGTMNDGGFQMTLLGGGTSSLAGVNPINSYTTAGSSFTGSLVLGNSGGTEGAKYIPASLAATSITTGSITIFPNSQLSHALAGNFGNAASTLTLYGNGLANTGGAITTTNAGTTTWLGATVLGANTTITPGTSNILVLNGNFSGAFQLTKSGAGTLTLNGTNSSNTSSTVITNGTLTVNSGSSLGTGDLTMSQTTGVNTALNLNESQSVSSLLSTFTNTTGTFTQVITIASGKTLTVNQSTNTTYGAGSVATLSSTIAGAGNLIKSAAGILTFTSVNTHTGTTTINGGTLTLSGLGSIATSSTITIGSSGTFDVSGLTTALTLGASQTLRGSATGSNTTGTIKVASSKGITLSAGGLAFTAYDGGATAPLTISGASAGALALASATVTVTTTSALGVGTYKLIAKGLSATGVSGSASSLTIGGSGLASNTSASLSVVSGELIMTVVSTDANLSALSLSSGTLSPVFASGTITYTASVTNATTSITLTPTRNQANATIQVRVNGGSYTAVTSGNASGSLSLNVNDNTVDVLVTAQDGSTTKTYTITVTRAATTPSAPTITSITPGNQELSVAFTTGNTGGSAITNYKYSTDGGTTFINRAEGTTASPLVITTLSTNSSTGLTNGTTYDVQIKAVNAEGDGTATATTQGTPTAAAVAPGEPTITSITPSDGELSVAFTAGATGGSVIISYQYSTDGGLNWQTRASGTTASPLIINTLSTDGTTGLSNGVSYDVQIRAVNAVGNGTASTTTTSTPSTTASAPTISSITAGNQQLSVAFTAGGNGGSAITSYKYSTDGGTTFRTRLVGTTASPLAITTLSTDGTTALINGTSYNVQIKAVNSIGDGTATASTAATPITTPGAPTIGTATAGNGQATVTFTAPASNGGSAITSYTATSTPGSVTGTLNQAGSGTITVTGLTNGTAYTFTIKANNAAGASAASVASNSVTPVLSAPVANDADPVLADGFTANWNAVAGASSGYLLDVSTSATFEATALATDLFISEYIEGSSNNKYIEIFNGTGATVDLSLYELGIAANSGGTPTYSTMIGSLANGATIVYKNSGAALTLPAGVTAINSGACNFNGDDAIVLHKVGEAAATFVDVFGRVGSDPGTAWLSTSNSTLDKTLARKSSIISGITSSPTGTGSGAFTTLETEWTQSNIDIVSGLGSHSISVITPSFVSGYNAQPISGQATVTSSVTGLSEATTYYFRVRATDGITTTADSNVKTVTTKQTPTVTPTVGTYTYTGSAQGPDAATNTGTGSTYTFSYSGTGATTYGPNETPPIAAGTYTVTASVAADGDYVEASSSATAFTIAKASSSVTVTGSTSFIYSGSAQGPATSTVTGSSGAVSYSYSGVSPTVYGPSATAPTNVGSYTVTASVAADANYLTANSAPTAFGIVYPTNDWIGGNSNWNTPGNWSLSSVPLSTDNITISTGSPVMDVSHTIDAGRTLTLSGTASLTINPNAILTIAGTADFGGKSVTLKSDATGTAAIGQVTGTLSNATSVTVERYIPSKRAWRALTAPLKGSNTSLYSAWQNNGSTIANTGVALWGPSGTGLASGPAYNIRRYTTSGWSDVTDTQSTNLFTTLANNAFMVFVTGEYGSPNIGNGQSAATTLKATGELITGTVNYSLSSTNHTLIGNPYASPISPELILANTSNTNTALLFPYLWVWNPAYNTNGAYEMYDKVLGYYSGGNLSAGTAIQSGQAFFVRTETAARSLTLTESMKSSNVSPTFRNSNSIAASIFRASFLKQTTTDWMPLDGCIAGFYEGANAAADDADGKKMINTGENIGFVRNAVNLSSEHYPLVTAQDILNLKIWNTQQAHYKLKLNTEEFTMVGVEAWLQDLYTGTSQQLNLDGSMQDYEFDVDPTVSASSGTRFRIVFTNTALAVDTPTQGQLSIYPNPATGGKVTVSLPTGNFEGCSYELINVLGQVVRQDEIANANSSQVTIPITGLPNSWYALRIIKENSVMYQGKLIIKN